MFKMKKIDFEGYVLSITRAYEERMERYEKLMGEREEKLKKIMDEREEKFKKMIMAWCEGERKVISKNGEMNIQKKEKTEGKMKSVKVIIKGEKEIIKVNVNCAKYLKKINKRCETMKKQTVKGVKKTNKTKREKKIKKEEKQEEKLLSRVRKKRLIRKYMIKVKNGKCEKKGTDEKIKLKFKGLITSKIEGKKERIKGNMQIKKKESKKLVNNMIWKGMLWRLKRLKVRNARYKTRKKIIYKLEKRKKKPIERNEERKIEKKSEKRKIMLNLKIN